MDTGIIVIFVATDVGSGDFILNQLRLCGFLADI